MLCPCCKGKGQIEDEPPVTLTPTQTKIYNAVRAAKHGIGTVKLADRVYGEQYDGGPDFWYQSIQTHIFNANRRLASVGRYATASVRWGKGSPSARPRAHGNCCSKIAKEIKNEIIPDGRRLTPLDNREVGHVIAVTKFAENIGNGPFNRC